MTYSHCRDFFVVDTLTKLFISEIDYVYIMPAKINRFTCDLVCELLITPKSLLRLDLMAYSKVV